MVTNSSWILDAAHSFDEPVYLVPWRKWYQCLREHANPSQPYVCCAWRTIQGAMSVEFVLMRLFRSSTSQIIGIRTGFFAGCSSLNSSPLRMTLYKTSWMNWNSSALYRMVAAFTVCRLLHLILNPFSSVFTDLDRSQPPLFIQVNIGISYYTGLSC